MSASLVYDPYSGAIDVYGAILLACGADDHLLAQGEIDPDVCGAPEANWKKIILAVEYFEAMTDMDITEWSAKATVIKTVSLLENLSDRIQISVVGEREFRS
jgi:hypothetical protein